MREPGIIYQRTRPARVYSKPIWIISSEALGTLEPKDQSWICNGFGDGIVSGGPVAECHLADRSQIDRVSFEAALVVRANTPSKVRSPTVLRSRKVSDPWVQVRIRVVVFITAVPLQSQSQNCITLRRKILTYNCFGWPLCRYSKLV